MIRSEMSNFILWLAFFHVCFTLTSGGQTTVSIVGENFYVNNEITYKGASNSNVQGLLINSRMINAIFDNSATKYNYLFEYPDTGEWDPTRNTHEFVGNLSKYKEYGMLSFTVGLQGGDPFGYTSNEPDNVTGQPWINSAYNDTTGDLNEAYFARLESILAQSDEIGMTPIVQMFYNAQIYKMKNDTTIMRAINNTLDWYVFNTII